MIEKKPGDNWGFTRDVEHTGPARYIQIVGILAPTGLMHTDPVSLRPENWCWFKFYLPEAAISTITPVFIPVGQWKWPSHLKSGKYDVNIAIGPVRANGQSNADWYSKRYDDDWDDDVYEAIPEAQASASLPADGAAYY